ncbi:serine hydrolase-like protein 2 isoform b, partial [Daubentonia madagascariensis]
FHYIAIDLGGHGLSSHYSPGFPYYHPNFVSDVRRVAAGGTVGGMFSCIFPEMVDKLILLDSLPFALDCNEIENLLTYKRRAIEHVLQVETLQKPPTVVSPEEMLRGQRTALISSARRCLCAPSGSCRPTSCSS